MSYTWIPSTTHQGLVPSAVYAGNDADGSPLYVGRAFHEGNQLPAKVIPSKQAAYVGLNGQEIFKHHFECLSGNGFTWIGSGNGHVPPGAVTCGNSSTGEPIYVGRAHHEGSLTVGKVIRSLGAIYLPFNGMEHVNTNYEVLCSAQVGSNWTPSSAGAPPPPGAIVGGNDSDGSPIYIGRTWHEGEQVVVKVVPSKQIGLISFNGQEIPKYQFEILCNGNVSWVHSGHGTVLPNAVPGGRTSSGETLYIGRVPYAGSLTIGKVHPSHRTCYIAFNGAEIPMPSYEILIEN